MEVQVSSAKVKESAKSFFYLGSRRGARTGVVDNESSPLKVESNPPVKQNSEFYLPASDLLTDLSTQHT